MLIETTKSHLDLHCKLNSILPHDKLHPQIYKVDQVLGAHLFMINFIKMYKENQKMNDNVYF